jgi:hypothetical protein
MSVFVKTLLFRGENTVSTELSPFHKRQQHFLRFSPTTTPDGATAATLQQQQQPPPADRSQTQFATFRIEVKLFLLEHTATKHSYQNVGATKGSHQECGHERGDAAGCCGYCFAGVGEVQH